MPGEPLTTAIQLIKAGNKQEARKLLVEVLKHDPRQELAWMWLVETADTATERTAILRSSLKYIPDSQLALRALRALSKKPFEASPTGEQQPVPGAAHQPNIDETDNRLQEVATLLGMQPSSERKPELSGSHINIMERMHQTAETAASGSAPPPDLPIERPRQPRRHLPRWIWFSLIATFILVALGYLALTYLINQPDTEPLPPTIQATTTLPSPTIAPTDTPENLPSPTPRATWTPFLSPTSTLTPTITPTPTLTPTVTPLTFNPINDNRPLISADNLSQITLVANLGEGAVYAPLVNWVAKVQFDEVVIWNATSNTEVARFQLQFGTATGLAISDDGQWVAASNTSFLIQIWNVPARTLTHSFGTGNATSIPPDTSTQMVFSPDSNYLAVSNKGVFSVWDLRDTQQPIAYFAAEPAEIQSISADSLLPPYFSVSFNPDNTQLVASGYHAIILVDLVNWDKKVLTTPETFQHRVLFSPDGSYIAAAGSGFVNLLLPTTGLPIRSFEGALFVDQLPPPFTFNPDNRQLEILSAGECCGQTVIKSYSIPNGTLINTSKPFENPPSYLGYSPLGDIFLTVIPGNDEIGLTSGDASVSLSGFEFLQFARDQRAIIGLMDNTLVLFGIMP